MIFPSQFAAWLVAALDVHTPGLHGLTVMLGLFIWLFSIVVVPSLIVGLVDAHRKARRHAPAR